MANPNPPLSQVYPDLYKQWTAAGGAEDAFRAHALAVSVPTPTQDDLGFLVSHSAAALNELNIVLKKIGSTSGMTATVMVVNQIAPA